MWLILTQRQALFAIRRSLWSSISLSCPGPRLLTIWTLWAASQSILSSRQRSPQKNTIGLSSRANTVWFNIDPIFVRSRSRRNEAMEEMLKIWSSTLWNNSPRRTTSRAFNHTRSRFSIWNSPPALPLARRTLLSPKDRFHPPITAQGQ